MLHRADLHGVLADAVRAIKPDAVHLNSRLSRLTQDGVSVEAAFENGTIARGAYADRRRRHPLEGARRAVRPGSAGVRRRRGLARARADGKITRAYRADAGHQLARPTRPCAALSGAARRVDELHQLRGARRLAGRNPGSRRARSDELANDFRGWHDDVHAIIRHIATPYKWAHDGARADAALERRPRHAARRRLPSDAAVPRPGRRDGDRGRLHRGGVPSEIFRRPGARRSRATRRSAASAPPPWCANRTRTAVRRSARRSPIRKRSASKWRANGSRSACASGWSGSTPTTRPASRCDPARRAILLKQKARRCRRAFVFVGPRPLTPPLPPPALQPASGRAADPWPAPPRSP